MTESPRRSRIVSAAALVLLAIAAVVFREPLVAWFTGKPLGGQPGAPTSVQAGALSLEASLDPDPPRTSGNALLVTIADTSGHPIEGATLSVEYDMPAMGAMSEMKGKATVVSEKAGRYRATFDLPMAGSWTLKVRASAAAGSVAQDFTITVGTPGLHPVGGAIGAAATNAAEGGIDHYTCSMHPSVHQKAPGKCPICGMDLVPVTKEQQRQGVVTITPARQQLIGVRTGVVRETPMVRSLRAIGRVVYDESRLTDVNLKVRGWIGKLLVTNTGQRVQKGQTLFTLYSPELYNAQQDFLLALRAQSDTATSKPSQTEGLAKAARQRLRLLDISDAQIDQIAQRSQPDANVAFAAPESGFVIEKNVVEGAAVEPGMRLYRIAALDRVWIEADVYEADFMLVRAGQKASVTLDYLPGRSYDATVTYIYPYLNSEARTGRVRLELVNRKLELRPGMYASVQLESDLGKRLQVPASAIVYTGPRRLAFVDLGEGRFRPQEVTIGAESDGMYEVLSGLSAGDVVATSGVFLIAAEARISTAAKYWHATEAGEIGAANTELPPQEATPKARPAALKPTSSHEHAASATPMPESQTYTCPMHPEVQSTAPGKCPKCGMDLVPAPPPGAR